MVIPGRRLMVHLLTAAYETDAGGPHGGFKNTISKVAEGCTITDLWCGLSVSAASSCATASQVLVRAGGKAMERRESMAEKETAAPVCCVAGRLDCWL